MATSHRGCSAAPTCSPATPDSASATWYASGWTDIDEGGFALPQKKTGVRPWCPIFPELEAEMATWERRPGPFLLQDNGRPFTTNQLWKVFRQGEGGLSEAGAGDLARAAGERGHPPAPVPLFGPADQRHDRNVTRDGRTLLPPCRPESGGQAVLLEIQQRTFRERYCKTMKNWKAEVGQNQIVMGQETKCRLLLPGACEPRLNRLRPGTSDFGLASRLRGERHRSTVVVGNCTVRADNGGILPGESITPLHVRRSCFGPMVPNEELGGAAGYRPRVRSAYSARVYHHSPVARTRPI